MESWAPQNVVRNLSLLFLAAHFNKTLLIKWFVGRQSKKWYKYLFCFFFNWVSCSTYILGFGGCVKRPHYNFYLELTKQFINFQKYPATMFLHLSQALLTTHSSSKIDSHKRQWEDKVQEQSRWNKNFYVISVELHSVETSCTDQSLLSKKNKLLIFHLIGYWLLISQVIIPASAASDIEVSTDRFVLSPETVSKR